MDPPTGWASIDDCGEFPCTAPENFAIAFTDCTWTDSNNTVGNVEVDITGNGGYIVPNNSQLIPYFYPNGACTAVPDWNGFWCPVTDDLGCLDILMFENNEGSESSYHRSIQPVVLSGKVNTHKGPFYDDAIEWTDLGSANALNSFMDHVWDGFYTGQTRRSRFPALVQTNCRADDFSNIGENEDVVDYSY